MARSIWTGAISFGLVTVPVKLYTATQSHKVSFHQFREGTNERIRNQRVGEDSGKEVDYEDIVKGAEVSDGEYVIVTPEELAAVEPGRTKSLEIEDFVDLDEVDPIYWNKTYYLGPAGETAESSYALLRQAMVRTNKVAIGRFVMRDRQYLATIRPLGNLLALSTMFFADEIRDENTVTGAPVGAKANRRHLEIAEQLIDSMTTKWKPEKYQDTYQDKVKDLIKRKAKGEDIVVSDSKKDDAPVADIMEALRASVEASKKGKRPTPPPDADDLDALSKEELYEQATKADINGRSSMSKQELIKALRKVAA